MAEGQVQTMKHGLHSRDVTHWFVDSHFEALSFCFGRRHLVEPEVTVFGKEDHAEDESHDARP